jgi:hypothetical protein
MYPGHQPSPHGASAGSSTFHHPPPNHNAPQPTTTTRRWIIRPRPAPQRGRWGRETGTRRSARAAKNVDGTDMRDRTAACAAVTFDNDVTESLGPGPPHGHGAAPQGGRHCSGANASRPRRPSHSLGRGTPMPPGPNSPASRRQDSHVRDRRRASNSASVPNPGRFDCDAPSPASAFACGLAAVAVAPVPTAANVLEDAGDAVSEWHRTARIGMDEAVGFGE